VRASGIFDSHRPLHFPLFPVGLCPRRGIRAVLRFQSLDASQLQSLASDSEDAEWDIGGGASNKRNPAAGLRPRPFASVADLVASSDIDVVSVTVRVPYHLDVVKTAITAGKHVYCEWPLGNGLAEALELARLAKEKDVLGVVGMQACLSPEILYMKQLIADGFVGEVLSTTLIARGGGWGGEIPEKKSHAYLLDNTNGATMLTIPVGHALAGLQAVLGDVENVSAVLATRRSTAHVVDSGEKLPVTAPDQVLVSGVLTGGAPVSLHYRGGMPRDRAGLLWEINGTEGDLRITGPFGHLQFALKSPSAAVIAARTWLSDWVNFR